MALVEEGAQQEDDGDVLVVTEALPSTARSTGQGASAQGALVRNILEAEKALQVAPPVNPASSHFWVLSGDCLQSHTILQRSTCLCARFVDLKMHIGAILKSPKTQMAKALQEYLACQDDSACRRPP